MVQIGRKAQCRRYTSNLERILEAYRKTVEGANQLPFSLFVCLGTELVLTLDQRRSR